MTISMSAKRFYVGNLFNEVKEDDLHKLFNKFGTIEKVEIKHKSDVDGNVLTTFAFVTLQNISDDKVATCIKQCNNLKWKKQTIKVQVAQESFLSRLQREREEATKPKTEPVAKPVEKLNAPASNLEQKLRHLANTELFSKTAKDKNIVTFGSDDSDNEDTKSQPVNNLERSKRKRVYHSSSSEGEEDEDHFQSSKSKKTKDVLSKLESFDGGFWCDEGDEPLPIPKPPITKVKEVEVVEEAEEETKSLPATESEVSNPFKTSTGNSGFSLLSTFGSVKNIDNKDASETVAKVEDLSDTFAFKLKEKAAIESAKGDTEPFFFAEDDKRLVEGRLFLQRAASLQDIRTKYEEKRPILASIMKKKVKNRTKKQEKMAFSSTSGAKGKKKFNIKRKSGKKFKH